MENLSKGFSVRRRDQGRDEHPTAEAERAAKHPAENQRSQHEGHGET